MLKSRKVEPKPKAPPEPPGADPDAFLKDVHKRFVARVGRPMTDRELDSAETCISVGKQFAKIASQAYTDTADDVARRVEEKIWAEPAYYRDWRSLGIDPVDMEKRAEDLRLRLHGEHPEMGWRERMSAVYKMWDEIDAPLRQAKQAQRAAARAAKKADRVRTGQLGFTSGKRPVRGR